MLCCQPSSFRAPGPLKIISGSAVETFEILPDDRRFHVSLNNGERYATGKDTKQYSRIKKSMSLLWILNKPTNFEPRFDCVHKVIIFFDVDPKFGKERDWGRSTTEWPLKHHNLHTRNRASQIAS
jgi:hypothetical protein